MAAARARVGMAVASRASVAEDHALEFIYAGLGICALPHKNIDAGPLPWRYSGDDATYVLRDGVLNGDRRVGVPYGSKARLILLHLQDAACRRRSRTVELGSSLYWVTRSGHPQSIGGMTYRLAMDQAMRLAGCRLAIDDSNGAFVQTMIQPTAGDAGRDTPPRYLRDVGATAMPTHAVLDQVFYDSFIERTVPVSVPALRQLSNNSVAIDVYVWLCHRLPTLTRPQSLSWSAVCGKFGAGYKVARYMRRPFLRALALALSVYPEARVKEHEGDVMLYPSRPAVDVAARRTQA